MSICLRTKWKRQNNIRLDELRYSGGKSGPSAYSFKGEPNSDSNDEVEDEMEHSKENEESAGESVGRQSTFDFPSLAADRAPYHPTGLTMAAFGQPSYLQPYLPNFLSIDSLQKSLLSALPATFLSRQSSLFASPAAALAHSSKAAALSAFGGKSGHFSPTSPASVVDLKLSRAFKNSFGPYGRSLGVSRNRSSSSSSSSPSPANSPPVMLYKSPIN